MYIRPHKAAFPSQRIVGVSLRDYADVRLFKSGLTFSAGDVKISAQGGSFANIDDIANVTAIGGGAYEVALTEAESDYGRIILSFIDQDGPLWCSEMIFIDLWGEASSSASVPLDISGIYNPTTSDGEPFPSDAYFMFGESTKPFAKQLGVTISATVKSTPTPTVTSCVLENIVGSAWAIDDLPRGRHIVFVNPDGGSPGDLVGAITRIQSFDQSSGLLTYATLPQAPATGDAVSVLF